MEEFYVVSEIQNAGTPAVLNSVYTNENQAYSQYYHILSIAAVSDVPYHGASIFRASDAMQIEGKAYTHVSANSAE